MLPMMSKGSPYWVIVHSSLIWTRTPPSVQVQLPACWRPRLCPNSWAITCTLWFPLSITPLAATPSTPSHVQLFWRGNM